MGVSLEEALFVLLNDKRGKHNPLDITPFGEEVVWWIKNSPSDDIAEAVSDLRERWKL